jgi:phosphatidate cytidylyltransferase
MGVILIVLVCGLLLLDQYFEPYYPCLLTCLLLLGLVACRELHHLLAAYPRPPYWLCAACVCAVLVACWPAHLGLWGSTTAPQVELRAWRDVLATFAGVVLVAFLAEMAVFRTPGGAVVRLSLLVWMTAYLGLLPSFLAQLRWWPDFPHARSAGAVALALTIFVAKVADIGAYFTGRLLGRHKMSPVLSPKKTWEGLAGGLLASVLLAIILNRLLTPALLREDWRAALFGLSVGGAGVLGDLAESMIKRDAAQKDASRVVPGFGGILDVVDSILFAAPVAYWWLRG